MRSINKTIARDPTKCIRRKGQTAPQVSNQTVNTSGQAINQTALQVGVSKNLFGDRVKVSVGSDFQL